MSHYSTPKKAKPSFIRKLKAKNTAKVRFADEEGADCEQSEEEEETMFSKKGAQILDCRQRATSASKLKVFSTKETEDFVDGKIQEVVDAVEKKKRLEKQRNELRL
mmetsp:Transcript_36780/g.27219  ORF Transcript_36780/g.27219 Transcript_36780/m.27219 type:complete len:106 (+) Transcript_36780:346-663(+)